MIRLLLFSGSLRRDSFNTRLLDYCATRLEGRCEIDRLNPDDVNLPLFNQDIETDPALVAQVVAIAARIMKADGLLVATPEYNGQTTPYVKNTVDWLSRLPKMDRQYGNPFSDRPTLLCSATTGWTHGIMGLSSARALFTYVGCHVLSRDIRMPFAHKNWDHGTQAFSAQFTQSVDPLLDKLLHVVTLFRSSGQ